MTPRHLALLALAFPVALEAQATAAVYRGFAPGAVYRDFAERARALAVGDPLVCNTSKQTAQLMECGVVIRDPADSATFYLSAYVLEGRVAFVSFGDSGAAPLVDRVRADLAARFGAGKRTGYSTLEWTYGRQVIRFNWRGRGQTRWIYVTLWDGDVMDRISRYVNRKQ
ncbi:MAG: hypothetical protein ACREMJ_00125 [Gemmatimonadales bacterium]